MYSHTVVFLRPVVISRDGFLINSSGSSIAVGFHKLPRSKKKKKTKNQLDCSPSLLICFQIGGSPYLHQLILPIVQFYGFDLTGQAAVDARAVQTHKHTELVGCPFWPWDVQQLKDGNLRGLDLKNFAKVENHRFLLMATKNKTEKQSVTKQSTSRSFQISDEHIFSSSSHNLK